LYAFDISDGAPSLTSVHKMYMPTSTRATMDHGSQPTTLSVNASANANRQQIYHLMIEQFAPALPSPDQSQFTAKSTMNMQYSHSTAKSIRG